MFQFLTKRTTTTYRNPQNHFFPWLHLSLSLWRTLEREYQIYNKKKYSTIVLNQSPHRLLKLQFMKNIIDLNNK